MTLCDICQIIEISADKSKLRCYDCQQALLKYLDKSENFEAFKERQAERMRIIARNPKELSMAQKREAES